MPMDPRLMRPKRREAGDPYWANVELLLHFDGADESQSFINSSPGNLAVTVEGDVAISTDESRFGGSSGLFVGDTLNYLGAACDLSSGPYTVEAWFFAGQDNSGDHYNVIGGGFQGFPERWVMDIGVFEGLITLRALGGSNSYGNSASDDYTPSTWVHVAWVNDATADTFSAYLNGERIALDTAFNPPNYSGGVQVGNNSDSSTNSPYYLDELRITKGVARYSGESFPVPAAPFPNG
jgi:hypothetical protein